jgi:hypothetical protein
LIIREAGEKVARLAQEATSKPLANLPACFAFSYMQGFITQQNF